MTLRLVQIRMPDRKRAVVSVNDDGHAHVVKGVDSNWALASSAIQRKQTLESVVLSQGRGEAIDLRAVDREGRLLAPIDHPDPAHLHLTGTGLTHLGSAEGRDKMHRDLSTADQLTDSMRQFLRGVKEGKPQPGRPGVQPEWFYKGDGASVIASGESLVSPAFALDGGEEPEICGIYLIGPDGTPYRLGFCLANEFSDHVMERQNYLDLAHSKLRQAALGAELLTGELPQDVRGVSRVRRAGNIIWEKPFLSGELNMSHSVENLERHHFKYPLFRRPGDVHVHFFGTATLSFTDGIVAQPGDVFEIEAAPFLVPLRNKLSIGDPEQVAVKML